MLPCLVTAALSFSPLRLPPAAVVAPRGGVASPCMQLPDLGKMGKQMGSKFMDSMGLGMGDTGLSEEESAEMEARLKAGEMSFDDFMKQVNVMQKMGNLQSLMKNSPFGGGGGAQQKAELEEGQKKLVKYSKYVELMPQDEREDPTLLIEEAKLVRSGAQPVRLQALADASGASVEEVGQFITEFSVMRKAAVAFARGESPDKIKQMMTEETQAVRPPLNRQMRRMKAKKEKKKAPASRGFGR